MSFIEKTTCNTPQMCKKQYSRIHFFIHTHHLLLLHWWLMVPWTVQEDKTERIITVVIRWYLILIYKQTKIGKFRDIFRQRISCDIFVKISEKCLGDGVTKSSKMLHPLHLHTSDWATLPGGDYSFQTEIPRSCWFSRLCRTIFAPDRHTGVCVFTQSQKRTRLPVGK